MKKTISGIRGIVGDDLSVADVMEFCSNFCMLGNSKCVIARDTRPSGAMLKEAACAAMLQNGTDVMDLGIAPTPVVFWEARRCGAGVIVTSSHNPLEWNGLKFIVKGRGINSEQLRVVDTKQNMPKVKHGSEFPLDSLYVDNAAKTIASRCENEVVVDIGGGAAIGTAPELLKKLGCTVHTINENPSNTGRGPDPTVDSLTQLVDASSKHGLGFAFDLDGDRMVLVVDGKKQSPDATLALGVAKALDLGIKKFTLSIDTSIAVEKIILKGGGELTRSRVGEANVVEEMRRTGARAGGEGSSGGFILPEFNYCRDGILTAGFAATMDYKQIRSTVDEVSKYSQSREKVAVKYSEHEKVLAKVALIMEKRYDVITLDGIKGIVDADSWVLVRASNTEDVIRNYHLNPTMQKNPYKLFSRYRGGYE